MRYAIVIEPTDTGFSAYVPDVSGCVATGESIEAVECAIREALAFHFDGMRDDGDGIPLPSSRVNYVDVAA